MAGDVSGDPGTAEDRAGDGSNLGNKRARGSQRTARPGQSEGETAGESRDEG